MAARKFASDFESLANQSAGQTGNWCDLGDCEQIEYGLVQGSGTVASGVVQLISRRSENHPPMLVNEFDVSTLGLDVIGFQSSEPRPHGTQFAWKIKTAIGGGTITATINGRHKSA